LSCGAASVSHDEETPRAIVQAAIKAHGGEANIARTLTGKVFAKVRMRAARGAEAVVSWEETFELPRRYHRRIKGQASGKDFSMEYAITDGSGWIRRNGGDLEDYRGEKAPLSRSWLATLALLPACLADGVELTPGSSEKVGGREAVGVRVSGEDANAVLFFDRSSHLLLKSKKRMPNPVSRKEVEGELLYGDYKEVSGVQYPHRITASAEGEKILEVEITKVEFLKKVEDRLFDWPEP
jgi:hypothetical protein